MISLFMNLIKTGLLGILFNDYLQRNFPEKHIEICISISYELIRLYSKGQLFYNKVVTQINSNPRLKEFIDAIYKKDVQKNTVCRVDENYKIQIKQYTHDNTCPSFEPDKKSIYILSDNEKSFENKCVNKVIRHSYPFSSKYEVSNIQFLLVEVKINNTNYKMNLKTDEFNYYIVDNILDLRFFKHYLHNYGVHYFKDELERIQLDKLSIKIIDHNVTMKELEITDDKFIIIKKDDYIY